MDPCLAIDRLTSLATYTSLPAAEQECAPAGRRFGAGRFVIGDPIEVNGTLRASASLFAGGQESPVAVVMEEGHDSSLFQKSR